MSDEIILELWDQQQAYNERLRQVEKRTPDQWVTHHAMGLQEEVFELLRAVDWKFHRAPESRKGQLVPWELADITKYVLSLWQDFGYNMQDMVYWLQLKSDFLEFLWRQEHDDTFTDSVLICDMDGVIADFRTGFIQWLSQAYPDVPPVGNLGQTIHMDLGAGWGNPWYERVKREFEMNTAGYAGLPATPLLDSIRHISDTTSTLLFTARPRNGKTLVDTWQWLQIVDFTPRALHVGAAEARIEAAEMLLQRAHRVVLLDDDPTLLQRALTVQGLHVVRVRQPYNEHLNGSMASIGSDAPLGGKEYDLLVELLQS